MDAMALLCTLHADGPTTLRRLRASGIQNLAELMLQEADAVSRTLNIPAAAARRFVREAALLSDRVDEAPLERSSSPDVVPAGSFPAASFTVEPPNQSALSNRDQQLVDKVLQRWRTADQTESVEEPNLKSSPSPLGIESGLIDGLTPELSRTLADLSINTPAALGATDTLALSEATGVGFSTIRRLQFLARRVEPKPVPSEERLSVEERPRLEGAVRAWELAPEELREASEAGGPFA